MYIVLNGNIIFGHEDSELNEYKKTIRVQKVPCITGDVWMTKDVDHENKDVLDSLLDISRNLNELVKLQREANKIQLLKVGISFLGEESAEKLPSVCKTLQDVLEKMEEKK